MNMKLNIVAATFAIAISSSANAAPLNEVFLHAEDRVSSTAGCLVAASNPGPALAACFCAVSGGVSESCKIPYIGAFAIHPAFKAAWGTALGTSDSLLSSEMPAGTNPSSTTILMDARANCGLTQGSLELALSNSKDYSSLRGVLTGKAAYTAVYAFPVMSMDGNTWSPAQDANGNELNPIRVCSYGQASAFVAGSFSHRDGYREHSLGGHHGNDRYSINGNISAVDLGMAVGAEWAAANLNSYGFYGVKYLVVAGVADGLLQVGGKQLNAVGILANTRLSERSLHLENKSNDLFDVQDQDPTPSP